MNILLKRFFISRLNLVSANARWHADVTSSFPDMNIRTLYILTRSLLVSRFFPADFSEDAQLNCRLSPHSSAIKTVAWGCSKLFMDVMHLLKVIFLFLKSFPFLLKRSFPGNKAMKIFLRAAISLLKKINAHLKGLIALLRGNFALLRAGFALLRGNFALLRADFALLRASFALLRAEFALLRGEFALLRAEFALLRGDFALLRADFALLRGDSALLRAKHHYLNTRSSVLRVISLENNSNNFPVRGDYVHLIWNSTQFTLHL